jgi:integrase
MGNSCPPSRSPRARARRLARGDLRCWLLAGQANAALGILTTALSAARRARKVPANPCQGLRRLPVAARPRALTPLEVELIRARLPRPGDAALVSVLAYAGLRPEEALPLRWSDVGNTIVVSRTWTHGELRERTKTGRIRAVEVVDPLRADPEAIRPTVGGRDDLVFPSPPGPWPTSTTGVTGPSGPRQRGPASRLARTTSDTPSSRC